MSNFAIYLSNQLGNPTPITIQDLFLMASMALDKILALLPIRVTRQRLHFSGLKIIIIILALSTFIVSMAPGFTLRYAQEIIQKGFHFCSFDFAGCGNSGGEYVSLGCNEKWDVLRLIDTLKKKYKTSQYFLWGRSMGAATAIKFNSLLDQQQKKGRFVDIVMLGMILDSAFISLRRMAVEVGNIRFSVPQILIKAVLHMVSSSIQEKGGFKFQQLQLQQQIESIRCAVLLIASKDDTFVSYLHSEDIFYKLKISNKEIQYTIGEHYQTRDAKTTQNIYSFIQKSLKRYQTFRSKAYKYINSNQNSNRYYQLSPQKQSKSLKRYIDKEQRNCLSSSSKMLFHSAAGKAESGKRPSELSLLGLNKNIPCNSIQFSLNKQAQEKKHTKIKFLATNKEIKLTSLQPQLRKRREDYQTRQQSENQENHKNIISSKLRRKGKNQIQKIIGFKDRQQQDNINEIKFQHRPRPTHINFTIANTITPINVSNHSKSPQRISITAQQYKNHQIKALKSAVGEDKYTRAQIRIKQADLRHPSKNKSMNSLIVLGAKK